MEVVEVGFKLDKELSYYHDVLLKNGLRLDFSCVTHDIYYTNNNLDGLDENEMKNACIRLRSCNNSNYKIQNKLIPCLDLKEISNNELIDFEKRLDNLGYKKVFDTAKKDYLYYKDGMASKIQLQQIENIGLLVYYDNKNYYGFNLETQREKLIDELNSYGFDFDYDKLGLDKLRTLFYKKEMYSKNQETKRRRL